MASSSNPEKATFTQATDLGHDMQMSASPSQKRARSARALRSWPFLLLYTACCIALSLILALVIDGYNAVDTSTPRYINGKLQLRVSDITTLISVGLVIIKFLVTTWTAVAVWRCAFELTHNTEAGIGREQLSFMTKYKLPPWARYPVQQPKGLRSWSVLAILLSILPQPFIAPLLSGAVNWNPSLVPGSTLVPVNSTDPSAAFAYWYQYPSVNYTSKRNNVLRIAAGFASLAWSDSSTISVNGTSLTGNGCRHIVNDDGLPPNSTLSNSIVPCIKFHNISWATSAGDIPSKVANLALSSSLILFNDSIDLYSNPGHAVLFDPNLPWNSSEDGYVLPTPTLFSGTKTLALVVANQYTTPGCTNLDDSSFGDVNQIPQYINSWALGTCYLFANVTLTAGVTMSAISTYITLRVIEDQTPIDEVIFEPDPWVQDSFWLLPDLMTMVSVMNSSLLPTWDNIDLYAENLIRQTYLASWDSFHRMFDEGGSVSSAIPREPRIQATVSYQRVFAWLGVSLLMTVGGILLLVLTFGEDLPSDIIATQVGATMEGTKRDAKEIMRELANLDFF